MSHVQFVTAAYGIAFLCLGSLVVTTWLKHRWLQRQVVYVEDLVNGKNES